MIPHHKCHICHKQSSDCLLTDVANYSAQTGNLVMVSRVVCNRCREQITTIRHFVEQNQLSFGKNSGIYHQTVENYIHRDRQKDKQRAHRPTKQHSEIYQKSIQQQIKRNKLYHCAKLPQNCLQLVYYSSLTINHAERHQRIRNTIGSVMKIAPIPYMNLEDVAILIHCLSCFMHEDNVVRLMKIICQREIIQGIDIDQSQRQKQRQRQRLRQRQNERYNKNQKNQKQQYIEKDKDKDEIKQNNQQDGTIWRQLYRKCYIGNILIIIQELLGNWKNFANNFQKLRQYRGYIKKQHFAKIISNSSQNLNTNTNTSTSLLRKYHSAQQQPRQSQQAQLEYFQTGCKQCNNYRLQSLLSQAKVKNLLSLTLSSLIKQDAAHRQHVAQLEIKFMKEKQEFINKIIKLKDKIQLLEKNDGMGIDQSSLRRARSVSDCHGKKKFKPDLESVSEKSQGTSKTIQFKQKNQENGVNVKTTFQTDKSKESEPQNNQNTNGIDNASKNENNINRDRDNSTILQYLQKLATNIPEFDPSMLSPEADPKILVQTIENSLKKMRQDLDKLQKKTKLLENQSKRLLTILTRKQQRFVPLIHEKDQIIEKYQNALWRMQHGLIVQDPALATRIAGIINVFRNDFMESLSNGTLESDINYQEITKSQPQFSTPNKNKTTTKKKNKQKQKQKQRGSQKIESKTKTGDKDKDKQCMIF